MTGTAFMSAALGIADACGVMNRQPPRIIIEALLPGLRPGETSAVALVSHIGYGTAAGTVYRIVVAPAHRNTRTGILYGAAVWAAGYEGWLPLLGILPSAHKDKRGRALTMFVAHIIYGAALGQAAARGNRQTSQ